MYGVAWYSEEVLDAKGVCVCVCVYMYIDSCIGAWTPDFCDHLSTESKMQVGNATPCLWFPGEVHGISCSLVFWLFQR
jgi:hypothetical protein